MTARVDIEGVYTLEFASNLGFRGSGLVTLQDGHFRGNNASFEWTGSYELKGSTLHAEIKVQQFSGGVSIFGVLAEFNLVVSGEFEPRKMTLTGHRTEDPSDKVVVLMVRKSRL
jgi:hypothetical protein